MKIVAAQVAMQSQHAATVREERRERLRAWIGERPDFEGSRNRPARPPVQISEAGRAAQAREAHEAAAPGDPVLGVLRQLIELLTGRPVRVFDPSALQGGGETAEVPAPESAAASDNRPAGFGIEYDLDTVREESEATSFSAEGVVQTADGQRIEFKLDLQMSRQFREETHLSLRAGDARRKDPLVINFAGTAAQLTDQRFRFDLDADGRAEDLAMLAGGSGYLALDRNGNEHIDSGAELFGPATGQGFTELAAYDQDGNGWIDEGDAIFRQLRVWTPAVEGAGSLATLEQVQVGALFLGQLATPFELRGAQNADLGAVRASSLYLGEAGGAGTVQEIDLSV
jgi:hypothetical protein